MVPARVVKMFVPADPGRYKVRPQFVGAFANVYLYKRAQAAAQIGKPWILEEVGAVRPALQLMLGPRQHPCARCPQPRLRWQLAHLSKTSRACAHPLPSDNLGCAPKHARSGNASAFVDNAVWSALACAQPGVWATARIVHATHGACLSCMVAEVCELGAAASRNRHLGVRALSECHFALLLRLWVPCRSCCFGRQ